MKYLAFKNLHCEVEGYVKNLFQISFPRRSKNFNTDSSMLYIMPGVVLGYYIKDNEYKIKTAEGVLVVGEWEFHNRFQKVPKPVHYNTKITKVTLCNMQ